MALAVWLAPALLLLPLSAGCFGRDPIVITSADPSSKIPAIKIAVRAQDTSTAPQLVKDLDSDDPAVRFYAIRGLQDLTGETFGYLYYASDDVRKQAVKRWRQWLQLMKGEKVPADDSGGEQVIVAEESEPEDSQVPEEPEEAVPSEGEGLAGGDERTPE